MTQEERVATLCTQGVIKYLTPLLTEQRAIDESTIAALVNDVESLQAQVKTLQYDVARLTYRLEGTKEPSPW
jgi:cell division protein FtsB